MIRFEGKIVDEERYGSPDDCVRIEGELNGRTCRIVIEADGIARELGRLYGADDNSRVPIHIGNGEEL